MNRLDEYGYAGLYKALKHKYKYALSTNLPCVSRHSQLLLLLLLSLYLTRIPTSPQCFSVGSCINKLHHYSYIKHRNIYTLHIYIHYILHIYTHYIYTHYIYTHIYIHTLHIYTLHIYIHTLHTCMFILRGIGK